MTIHSSSRARIAASFVALAALASANVAKYLHKKRALRRLRHRQQAKLFRIRMSEENLSKLADEFAKVLLS
jgi:hypothetical protein